MFVDHYTDWQSEIQRLGGEVRPPRVKMQMKLLGRGPISTRENIKHAVFLYPLAGEPQRSVFFSRHVETV